MFQCHRCGEEWVTEKRVKLPGVKETCESCGAYLHCCLNCRFRDPSKHNECAVANSEWVGDKEGSNFCDHFAFETSGAEAPEGGQDSEARKAVDEVFGSTEERTDDDRLGDFKKLFDD